jgi:hypothetical protein
MMKSVPVRCGAAACAGVLCSMADLQGCRLLRGVYEAVSHVFRRTATSLPHVCAYAL